MDGIKFLADVAGTERHCFVHKVYILVSSIFFAKLLIFTGTVVPQFFFALLDTSAANIPTSHRTNYLNVQKLMEHDIRSTYQRHTQPFYGPLGFCPGLPG